jgi:phosphatidylserine/phosphatidylglycerophosphate/cardiolipin synthase-like enzyme
MMANALAILYERPSPPNVRILLSGEEVLTLNIVSRAQPALEKLWREIGSAAGKSAEFEQALKTNTFKMRMNLAYLSLFTSWNHSKLVIADEKRVVQGGHNLWADAYNTATPVSDLSMEASGPIAKSAQAFANTLWSYVIRKGLVANVNWAYGELPNRLQGVPIFPDESKYMIGDPNLPASQQGRIPMLALGRLGNRGENPSDQALKTLAGSSQESLKFVVQDLYGLISNLKVFVEKFAGLNVPIPADPTWLLDPIAKSVMRGVSVKVIQSDTKIGPNDYTLFRYQDTYNALVRDVEKIARKQSFTAPNGMDLRQYICAQIEYAPYRYKEGEIGWDGQNPSFASHAKMMIVDDSAFYIGSHNFYNANLQEFGIAVFDANATKRLVAQNWDLLWQASKSSKATCPTN